MSARDTLQRGDVQAALAELFDEVRAAPEQAHHRVFLFQLLCVAGEWDRALTQLNVASELDPAAGVMAKAYQEFLQCEALRRDVFEGKRQPLVFGDPEPWVAQMIEAVRLGAEGESAAAADLRAQALEAAPTTAGSIAVAKPGGAADAPPEESSFTWIADGDSRLGPLLEMVINGRYYWAPFSNIAEVVVEPPADLRDVVWSPAHFRWANQGEAVGVIPTRYVTSESSDDDAVRLARKTTWSETSDDCYHGLGQRVLMTDAGEYGLMDVRRINLAAGADG